MPSPSGGSRLFLAVGVLWAFRSVQSFTDPDFTDPGTLNDWVAVLSLSAATLLLAAALTALPGQGRRRFLLRLGQRGRCSNRHAADLDMRLAELAATRDEVERLRRRGRTLDPAQCGNAPVCHVISPAPER